MFQGQKFKANLQFQQIKYVVYIILHFAGGGDKILCWKWDGINLEHRFTKEFDRPISMAVLEDGLVYRCEFNDPAIHAFSILHPDSLNRTSRYACQ
jgi:hypothetical protein